MKLITDYNLNEHGFVLVENFYSEKEIKLLEFFNTDLEYPHQDEIIKGAELSFDFYKIRNFAETLTDKKYHIFMQKVNFKPCFIGSHEIYHQDYYYRQKTGIDSEEFLQVFIALENLDHAPLNIFVGSHKLGLLKHIMCVERNGKAKYRIENQELLKIKDSFKTIHMKKGSALFFNYKLVHGSSSNSSPFDQPRAIVQLCTQELNDIVHGSDRRAFEIKTLKSFLDEKL